MDPFTLIVMLLIAFLAWNSNVNWLFVLLLLLIVITSKSKAIAAWIIIGFGSLYFLGLTQYYFIMFVITAGIIIAIGEKKGSSSEYYSPELMRLLGG